MTSFLRYGAAFCALATAFAGAARAEPIHHPTAVFAGLDKTTGRIINFDVAIDETVQFGSLNVTPRVCNTRPQTEAPQTTSFVEVDELVVRQERQAKLELKEQGKTDAKPDSKQEAKRIFSGWMFAASPGLHGVEHPVYDVWLVDCKGGKENAPSPQPAAAEGQPAAPADAAAAAPAEAPKKKKSRKVEPKAPAPVENAPIGPADAAPPQPAVDGVLPPDAGGEAPAEPVQPKKKRRKPRADAPAAAPVEPSGGGLLPF